MSLAHTPFCNAFGPTPCACICEVVSKAELAALRRENVVMRAALRLLDGRASWDDKGSKWASAEDRALANAQVRAGYEIARKG